MSLIYNIKLNNSESLCISANILRIKGIHFFICKHVLRYRWYKYRRKYCKKVKNRIKHFSFRTRLFGHSVYRTTSKSSTTFIKDQNLLHIHILAKLLQDREEATGSNFSVVKGTRGQVPCKLYGRTGGSAPIVPQMTT
jgi:hypothetical protein